MATPQKNVLNEGAALHAVEIDLKAAIFTLERANQTAAIKEVRKVVQGALRTAQLTRKAIEAK